MWYFDYKPRLVIVVAVAMAVVCVHVMVVIVRSIMNVVIVGVVVVAFTSDKYWIYSFQSDHHQGRMVITLYGSICTNVF